VLTAVFLFAGELENMKNKSDKSMDDTRDKIACLAIILAMAFFAAPRFANAATLFSESFENTGFSSRGWYDCTGGATTTDHVEGTHAFECHFLQGGSGCSLGGPGRHQFTGTESLYLSYYVKYSSDYVGSGRSYHPHEFYMVTNKDSAWVGPAGTHLTVYVERTYQHPRLAIQDMSNVDTDCIRRNDGSWHGVSGCGPSYPFTENRSVSSCNGIMGDAGTPDCFQWDATNWYSARFWDPAVNAFSNSGSYNQNNWNHVEAYFEMNSIQDGIGVADGKMRYYFNGEKIMDYSHMFFRTGANADMMFNQLMLGPYIGDGSPADQYMWVDNLVVGTDDPHAASDTTPPSAPSGLTVL
jgi:hypothetical protein